MAAADASRPDPIASCPGLADPGGGLLGHLDGRGARGQPDLRAAPDLPARDGRGGLGPAGLHRAVQRADLRRRHAARPAVGGLGRQVQPQGGHRPERARRGRRVRRRGPGPRAVAGRARDAAHRLPAGQHRDHAGRHPRRDAARPPRARRSRSSARPGRSASPSGRRSPGSSSTASAGRCHRSSPSRRSCRSGPPCW